MHEYVQSWICISQYSRRSENLTTFECDKKVHTLSYDISKINIELHEQHQIYTELMTKQTTEPRTGVGHDVPSKKVSSGDWPDDAAQRDAIVNDQRPPRVRKTLIRVSLSV